MEVNEIEVLAHKGRKMPEFHTLPEMCLYQSLANIYSRYKSGSLDKAQAVTEKKQVLRAFDNFQSDHKRYVEVYKKYQRNIIKSEELLCKLNKSKSETETLYYALEIVSLLRNDSSLMQKTLERLDLPAEYGTHERGEIHNVHIRDRNNVGNRGECSGVCGDCTY